MSYAELEGSLKAVFNHPDHSGDTAMRVLSLRQGNCSVAHFSVKFWTFAADSGWNEPALREVFLQGLSERLQDKLLCLAGIPGPALLRLPGHFFGQPPEDERPESSPPCFKSSCCTIYGPSSVPCQLGAFQSGSGCPHRALRCADHCRAVYAAWACQANAKAAPLQDQSG